MNTKNFSEITVTEIVKDAKVARASYYRNFDSKEDIINSYMDILHDELVADIKALEIDKNYILEYNNLILVYEKVFTHALKNKSYNLLLYKNGFGSLIQNTLNGFAESILGDMPQKSLDRFIIYFMSGATFNIKIKWLQEGAIESPREVAKAFVGMLQNNVLDMLGGYLGE